MELENHSKVQVRESRCDMKAYVNNCVVGRTERLHVTDDPGIFTTASRLLPVPVVKVDRLVERFSEGDLRLSHDDGAVVLASHSLSVDLEVELAHAGSHRLLDVVIEPDPALKL